ncbi:7-carboxy-7-deazaguanine synthase QueE [Blattabacterium cuenoti]|uniref:7-carboxy-7-deazaguanine synthase QueE n=1 Tax=Blattabacterium cuenoti TaxID=1653831 RepID=UPI00163CC529|nr:7-carboxy-7-deazaguanine synthase QueE [Blattabacterium cuenoti]
MKEVSFPIKEFFYSLQGEGFHSGIAAYFIRFEGCDIRCNWCDTKYSWKIKKEDFIPIKEIIANIRRKKVKNIIITGGEPMMWDLSPLTKGIKNMGLGCKIHVETSGSYLIKDKNIDWVTISPKKNRLPLDENYKKRIHELKVIIFNEDDFLFAEKQASFVKKKQNCIFSLQPEWNNFNYIIPKIITYIKENPKWRLSLQIHKIINIP